MRVADCVKFKKKSTGGSTYLNEQTVAWLDIMQKYAREFVEDGTNEKIPMRLEGLGIKFGVRFASDCGADLKAQKEISGFVSKVALGIVNAAKELGLEIPKGEYEIKINSEIEQDKFGNKELGRYDAPTRVNFELEGVKIRIARDEEGKIDYASMCATLAHELLHLITSFGRTHGWLLGGFENKDYLDIMNTEMSADAKRALFGEKNDRIYAAGKNIELLEGANSILTQMLLGVMIDRGDFGLDLRMALQKEKQVYLDEKANASMIASAIGMDEFISYYTLGEIEPIKKAFCDKYKLGLDEFEAKMNDNSALIEIIAHRLGGIEKVYEMRKEQWFYGSDSEKMTYYIVGFDRLRSAYESVSDLDEPRLREKYFSLRDEMKGKRGREQYGIISDNSSEIKEIAAFVSKRLGVEKYEYLKQREIEVLVRTKLMGEKLTGSDPNLYLERPQNPESMPYFGIEMKWRLISDEQKGRIENILRWE